MASGEDVPELIELRQRVRRQIRAAVPNGSPASMRAAADTMMRLADLRDADALADVEARLTVGPLHVHGGDRDDDPQDWQADPALFRALAAWWNAVDRSAERASCFADAWVTDPGSGPAALFGCTAAWLATFAVDALVALLPRAGAQERVRLAEGFGQVGAAPRALSALTLLFDDEVAEVRRAAAQAVSRLSTSDEVADLLIGLLASGSARVRASSVLALAWYPGISHRHQVWFPVRFADSMRALCRLLVDPDPTVVAEAARLVDLATHHLDLIQFSPWNQPFVDVEGLALPMPPDVLGNLASAEPERVRAILGIIGRGPSTSTLGRTSPELVARLIAFLSDADYLTVGAALHALGRLGADEAIPAIRRLADQPQRGWRAVAILVLGSLGDDGSEHLLRALSDDLTFGKEARALLAAH